MTSSKISKIDKDYIRNHYITEFKIDAKNYGTIDGEITLLSTKLILFLSKNSFL